MKQEELNDEERIPTEEEVREILNALDVFNNTDENLKMIRKALSDIDPNLQAVWEKTYHEQWKDLAKAAALYYKGVNITLQADYYTSIITDILNGAVPPFWTCVDPDLEAFRKKYFALGQKVNPVEVVSLPPPSSKEECYWADGSPRGGMFTNPNFFEAISIVKKQMTQEIPFQKESLVRLKPGISEEYTLNENHLCVVLKTKPENREDEVDFLPRTNYPPERILPVIQVLAIKDSNGIGGYPLMVNIDDLVSAEG